MLKYARIFSYLQAEKYMPETENVSFCILLQQNETQRYCHIFKYECLHYWILLQNSCVMNSQGDNRVEGPNAVH